MSELKAMTVIDAYQLEYNDDDLVYLKSEVDAILAEKDEEIKVLKERLNTFRTFEKKMKDGSIVVCCETKTNTVMEYEKICKAVEDFRDRVRHQEEPYFDKLPEEVKAEIRKQHLEMVLNRDFKPMYVNVGPIEEVKPVHVNIRPIEEVDK